ncbi:MAG: hypothetical protein LBD30_05580 [Verrucomicrobiales bacterium]|nr:hypothetical protein [Verrucomicrobiales bacterium]
MPPPTAKPANARRELTHTWRGNSPLRLSRHAARATPSGDGSSVMSSKSQTESNCHAESVSAGTSHGSRRRNKSRPETRRREIDLPAKNSATPPLCAGILFMVFSRHTR